MRILILTHNYPISFAERRNAGIFVHDLAKELKKSGADVHIFCPSSSDNKGIVDGIPVYWFKWGSKKKSLRELKLWKPQDILETAIFFIKGIRASLKVAKKIKPDVCIAMWAVPSGVFAYFVKKRLKINYSIWVLGSDVYVYSRFPVIGQIIKKVLKEANHLFADGIDLTKKVKNISQKECIFLQSGTSFDPPNQITKNKKSKKQVLTFIGRMELEKGPDILVDALLQINERVLQSIEINFLGDGSLLEGLIEKSEKNNISSMTHFYGNVNSRSRIYSILQSSDWLIIPSRSDSIPLVFSEAMKVGVPVIAASLPDLKYLVDKYKIGLLFKYRDSQALSQVISNLPSSKERLTFSKNSKKVAKLFSLESTVKNILKIINEK